MRYYHLSLNEIGALTVYQFNYLLSEIQPTGKLLGENIVEQIFGTDDGKTKKSKPPSDKDPMNLVRQMDQAVADRKTLDELKDIQKQCERWGIKPPK